MMARGINPVVGVPVGVGTRDPVSYTHLRAHETVLDLVCRLLLEKKKNRKKTNGRMIKKLKMTK